MRSLDVIHAFFVPEFRTNEDIVPGLVTNVHITPDRVGTFPLICNELCGLGHSLMRTEAIVMTPGAFDKWLAQEKKSTAPPPAPSSSGPANGLAVFNSQPCSTCHTLTAAHATGKVGPDLDKLVSYAQQAHQPLAAFVHESIVSPNAYVQPGFQKNTMPTNFGQVLSKAQLSALVKFLVQSSQKASKKG
jgi:cytochrome c oxidase subunit 2